MMRYMEYPPGPALAGHVACFWTSEVRPPLPAPANAAPSAAALAAVRPAVSHRVLPDNCIDILWQDSGSAFAVGMMSRFIDVPFHGPVRTAAVRFLPGAAGPFLGMPLAQLADGRAELGLLWSRSDTDRLADALWSGDLDDRARLALIESALFARLALLPGAARSGVAQAWRHAAPSVASHAPAAATAPTAAAVSAAVAAVAPAASLARHAVAAIESSGGALRVEALADTLGVSRQHLSARFRAEVGITPKLFARITRFRRAMSAATTDAGHAAEWADLALSSGYFDQSHLIRDFQDFAGASPDTWLASR